MRPEKKTRTSTGGLGMLCARALLALTREYHSAAWVAGELGEDPGRVAYAMRKLIREGYVDSRKGETGGYALTAAGQAELRRATGGTADGRR